MATMTEREKSKWVVGLAVMVAVAIAILLFYDMAIQIPTVETEQDYTVDVGETFAITLPNYQTTSTAQNLYNHSYNYNYSYQWNISGTTDQNMFRHMNTVTTATQTTLYYKALEAGNATLTFRYRIEDEKQWVFRANIVVEG